MCTLLSPQGALWWQLAALHANFSTIATRSVFIVPTPNGYLEVLPLAIWAQINRSWHSNLLKSSLQFSPILPPEITPATTIISNVIDSCLQGADKMNINSFYMAKLKYLRLTRTARVSRGGKNKCNHCSVGLYPESDIKSVVFFIKCPLTFT